MKCLQTCESWNHPQVDVGERAAERRRVGDAVRLQDQPVGVVHVRVGEQLGCHHGVRLPHVVLQLRAVTCVPGSNTES